MPRALLEAESRLLSPVCSLCWPLPPPTPSPRLLLTHRPKQPFRWRSAVPVLCSDPLWCPCSLGGIAQPGSPQGSARPTAPAVAPPAWSADLGGSCSVQPAATQPGLAQTARPSPLTALPCSDHTLPARPALPRPCFLWNADYQPFINTLMSLLREKASPMRTRAASCLSRSLRIRGVPGTPLQTD